MHQFKSSAVLAFAALSLLSSTVDGHGMMVDPPPRAPASATNIEKFTPRPPTAEQLNGCFGLVAGTPGRTYQAGSQIEVKWVVPIPHANAPGVRIAIQYNPDEPFQTLLEGGDSAALSALVQLPAETTSNNAVIQWVWDSSEDAGFYAACGDVIVEAAGTAGVGTTPAASPTPAASATPVASPTPVASRAPVAAAATAGEGKNGTPVGSGGNGSVGNGSSESGSPAPAGTGVPDIKSGESASQGQGQGQDRAATPTPNPADDTKKDGQDSQEKTDQQSQEANKAKGSNDTSKDNNKVRRQLARGPARL